MKVNKLIAVVARVWNPGVDVREAYARLSRDRGFD
jgi:hypothetical protein